MTTQENRTLTYTLHGKTEGQQQLDTLVGKLRGVQAVLKELKKDAEGASLLKGVGQAAREQARVVKAEADAAIASSKAQAAEARRLKAEQDALTASLRAQGAQARLTAQLSLAASRDQQKGIEDTIRSLDNQQRSVRNLRQANQTYTVDMIEDQRRIQAEALKTAQLFDKASNEYRRLTGIAASAQRTIDQGLGKTTFGGFSAGVVTGIQNSGLFQQLAGMGGPATQSLGIIYNGFQNVKKGALEATGATNGAATAAGLMGAAGATAAVGLGALAFATVNAGKVALQFEQNMADAKVSVGGTAEEMKRLETAAMNMGKGLGFGAREAAQGIEALGSQGVNAQQALDGALQSSMVLARATTGNLSQAATLNAGFLNAFKLQARELPDVADTISAAVNNTTISMDNLAQGVAAGGSLFKSFGGNYREYVALLSIGTDAMLSATDAGTSIKSMLQALTPNSKEAKLAMKELGFSAFDAQGNFIGMEAVVRKLTEATSKLTPEQRAMKLETIFGSDAVRMINLLIDKGADGLRERTDLLNRTGEAQRSATEKMKTAHGATLEWQRATEKLQIAWASGILPTFTKFLNEVATPLIDKLSEIVGLLNDVKSPGELHASLKITSEDDATTAALKFLAGGVVQVKQTVGGIAQTYSDQDLRRRLIDEGLMPKPGLFQKYMEFDQLEDIKKRRAYWEDQLAQVAEKSVKAGQNLLKTNAAFQLPPELRPTGLGVLNLNRGIGAPRTFTQDKANAVAVAARLLGVNPNDLAAVISYETAGTFSTNARNPKSSGTGLIQFMQYTDGTNGGNKPAKWDYYGMTRDQFGSLSFEQQLFKYVVPYLRQRGIQPGSSLAQIYQAVAGSGYKRGSDAYNLNPSWDSNKDGVVSALEQTLGPQFRQHVRTYFAGGATSVGLTRSAFSSPSAPRPQSDQALIAEAKRILGKIEEYQKSGNATMLPKAQAALDTFEKGGARAAAALQIARSQLSDLSQETSKYGATYGKLDARLAEAEGWYKLNQNGQKYVATLQDVSAAALKAREAEGDTAKKAALFKLAGDAAEKARQVQAQADKGDQQRLQTRAQLEAQLDQQLAAGKLKLAQATASKLQQDLDTELAAHRNNAAERLRIEQELGPRVLAAQKRVLEAQRQQEINAARETARAELAKLTAQYGKGKEPADLVARIRATEAKAVSTAESTFQAGLSKLYSQSNERMNKATADVQAKNKQLADQRVKIEEEVTRQLAGLNEQQRQQLIQTEQDKLTELEQARQRRLDAAKGNAAEILRIEQETASGIADQQERVAMATLVAAKRRAEEQKALAVAAIPKGATTQQRQELEGKAEAARLAAVSSAYRAYSLAVTRAGDTASTSVRKAADDQGQAIETLKGKYQSLILKFSEKLATDNLTDSDVEEYWRDLNGLLGEAKKAGLELDPVIAGLRAQARELGNSAPGVKQWAQDMADALKVASGRYGNQDANMDYAMRGSYGVGQEGFQNALDAYGVRSIQELEGLNPVAAASMKRVYKDVLDQWEKDLQDAIDRGQDAIVKFQQQSEETANRLDAEAEQFARDKGEQDHDLIKGLTGRGNNARALTDYLQGAGNGFFGDRFWTQLGEQGREEFRAELEKLTPDDFASLGQSALQGLLDGMGDNEDWASLRAKVQDGLTLATQRGIGDDLMQQMNAVADEFSALQEKYAGVTDPEQLSEFKDAADLLATKAEAIAEAGKQLEIGPDLGTWATSFRSQVEVIGKTLEDVMEALNNGEPDVLDGYIQSIFEVGQTAMEAYQKGKIGAVEFNQTLTEQIDTYQQLYDRLKGMGPAYAEQAEGVRLMIEYFQKGQVDAEKLAEAMLKLDLAGVKKNQASRLSQFNAGQISADDLGKQTADDITRLQKVALNLERMGKSGAAREVRNFIQGLVNGLPTLGKAALVTTQLAASKGAINDARNGVQGLVGGSWRDFDAGWADQVKSMQEAKALYPEIAGQIDKLISKGKLFKGLNLFQDVAKSLNEWVQVGQRFASAFGEDEIAQGLGQISSGLEDTMKAASDWTRVAAGDLSALPSAIMNTVSALDNLLSGIQALNPAYQQWKKNQLEIVKLQREGAGQSKYNNWLVNPYYDELTQDANSREKLANAKPLQRVLWWITGSTPQVLDDATAKAKAKAGAIFNQFGQDLASTFEAEMMNAVSTGDWDGAAKNIDKMIDRFVNQMVIQTVLSKSKLSELIKQYADDLAAGKDTTNDLRLIREEKDRIIGELKTNADLIKTEADSIFAGLGDDMSSSFEDAMIQAWESGDFDSAERSMEAKINRFVASMSLKALMATSKMKELVDAYIAEYQAGGDTTDELAAIKAEQDRLLNTWRGMAPGLNGFASGQTTSGSGSTGGGNTLQRQEDLYRYESETDPARKEELRKKLLDGDGTSNNSGSVTLVAREGNDYASALDRLGDRLSVFEQAVDVQMRAANKMDGAADKGLIFADRLLQAAGLLTVSTSPRQESTGLAPAGNINF